MLKKVSVVMLAIGLAACAESPSSPSSRIDLVSNAADLVALGDRTAGAGPRELAGLQRLPENLKLTAAQEAAVKTLVDQFLAATAADRAALMAILTEAHDAREAGKSRSEVQAILAKADPIRQRMAAAESALGLAIQGVLTAEQKAWLAANPRTRDDGGTRCPQLTAAQHAQIDGLLKAFHEANQADLAIVAKAERDASIARRNGASAADVQKILDAAKPARDRLAAARGNLETAIANVLTAEQKACRVAPPRR
jgi:Spy/CpxP family protein refolding chaperone